MNSSEVKNEINETSSPMPPRNFIRTTTTETGLQVTATTVEGDYPTGLKIAKREMDRLSARPHHVCPQRNYTIRPRCAAKCEVIS
ncbi:MAG TPA: hypothetical protein VF515_22910 [Candidatus Binatia bacterium]